MKNFFIALLAATAFMLLHPGAVKAQEEGKDFRYVIKTNPLAASAGPLWVFIIPITGEYRVLFEAQTLKKQSVEFGASYLGPPVFANPQNWAEGDTSIRINGYRVQFKYKFFITKDEAPAGFYIAPHFSYATAKLKSDKNANDYLKASKTNFDAVLGYQLITKGGFALDIYTGLGFKIRDYKLSENGSVIDIDDLSEILGANKPKPAIVFGLNFGYAF